MKEQADKLLVAGRWKFGKLVWRFQEGNTVRFCHEKRLWRWVWKNMPSVWHHGGVVKQHTVEYWADFKKKSAEGKCLLEALRMAQESLDPETYDGFLVAYNALIDTRRLRLKKINRRSPK